MRSSAARKHTRSQSLPGGKALLSEDDERAVPGQLTGYWFARREEVPSARPGYDANGALLLRAQEGGETEALLLVSFDGIAFPLSEAADDTYVYTRALKEGRSYWFVEVPTGRRRWPGRILEVFAFAPALPRTKVQALYGDVAGRRARPEKKTVQVRVRSAG